MPNITLFRHRAIGEPSCSRLVRALSALGHSIHKTDAYDASTCADTDLLIRWGHAGRFPLKHGAAQINTSASIMLGSDKGETRRILQEASVSVPKGYYSRASVLAATDVQYPLIGRPGYHTQGQSIEFIKDRRQLERSTSAYWAEYVRKDREFRVYVFGGQALGVVEKIPERTDAVAWNAHKGAVLHDLSPGDYPDSIIPLALDAARTIGQHFSGVDIMTKGADAYVLELNSSIALSNAHRVSLFADAFDGWIQAHAQVHV